MVKDTIFCWSSYPDDAEKQILVQWVEKSETQSASQLKSWLKHEISSLTYALNKCEKDIEYDSLALNHSEQLRGIISGIEEHLKLFDGKDADIKIIRNLINSCRIHVDWIYRSAFE